MLDKLLRLTLKKLQLVVVAWVLCVVLHIVIYGLFRDFFGPDGDEPFFLLAVGISNNSGGNDWAWVQSANSAGAMYLKSATTQQWVATDKSMAFYFTVVPEPSGLALAALAAVGAAVTAARRRGRRVR